MNFFDIEKLDSPKAKNNTSQETFRIIKHNFNKIGNTIEANKYHSLELKKRRNQLKIFSTDFFTSWSLVNDGHTLCGAFLSDTFKYISIINYDDCIKKNPIIFILNKVLLGYFYYQFITAIRKDTRK
jgi:hypothetical protein